MAEQPMTVKDRRNADIYKNHTDDELMKSLRWHMSRYRGLSLSKDNEWHYEAYHNLRQADHYRLLLWGRGVLPMVDDWRGHKIRNRDEAMDAVRESVKREEWFKLDLAEAYRKMGYGHNRLKDFMREDIEPRPERDEWFPDLVERHRNYLAELAKLEEDK